MDKLKPVCTTDPLRLTFELRAVELSKGGSDPAGQNVQGRGDVPNQALEDVRDDGQQGLISEADEIVALQQVLRVVDSAGQIGQVDRGERVDGSRITADGDSLWHGELQFNGFEGESGDSVFVTYGSSVPVLTEDTVESMSDRGGLVRTTEDVTHGIRSWPRVCCRLP